MSKADFWARRGEFSVDTPRQKLRSACHGLRSRRLAELKNVIVGLVKRASTRKSSDPASSALLKSAHTGLLNSRCRLAILIGTAAFSLNTFEPWVDFHDLIAVKIQLGFALAMTAMTALSYTVWGQRHKLSIFECGFLIAVSGFEAVVVHERAFGTAYSAGFPVFFAFYCVFIPATVLRAALMGAAALAILTAPETIINGQFSGVLNALISNATAFVVLLCGRRIANSLWESEFRARESEDAAMRLQAEFISMVAHEFRTPLMPLCLISAQLAAGEFTSEEARFERYRALVEESHRLREVVVGLLEFGRIAATRDEYEFENIDPVELLQLVAEEFRNVVALRGRRVEVQVSQQTPLVKGNRVALRSVLWNLLDNATKYSPECDTVWASVGLEDGKAAIRIRDRGHGIQADEQQRIFERFVRGRPGKICVDGTGLGLALARYIVTAHHGELRVVSRLGEGSIFIVMLPAVN